MIDKTHTTTRPGGFFITGTDTEIGKSFVACCIAQGLLRQGIPVAPRKPVASGCIVQTDGELVSEDALQLKTASQSTEDLNTICRYQFAPPISPARAIQQSNQPIQLSDLAKACRVSHGVFALVEGAGGFLSPLAPDGLNADLAQRLGYPVILVVGNRLGCLNHALLTIEAIESRGLTLYRIVLNDITPDADPQNLTDLKQLTDYPVIHQPYQAGISALML